MDAATQDAGRAERVLVRSSVILKPDASRTVIRPFGPEDPQGYADPAHPRAQRIADRVLALDDATVRWMLERLLSALEPRHRELRALLLRRFDEVHGDTIRPCDASEAQRLLIGAYFSEEYSFEAAALFNPSIVPHPRGAEADGGGVRFLMSLRGIGEGHVSSVTFRTGTWSAAHGFRIDPASGYAVPPRIESSEGEGDDAVTRLRCDDSEDVSETVIFPTTPSQRQGVEDMRLVSFVDDAGETQIYGTYTAFDGRTARSELMHGSDFRNFALRPITGRFGGAKGMALFPRKVGGRYRMLSRQDSENIWLLSSNDLYRWDEGEKLLGPRYPWEIVQMGNCGSPIEIDEGWLVLTHGVGMARAYAMGACLLDKDDPRRVIARTPDPILTPRPEDRDGYVPNVVYSCGGIVHDRTLLLPYGVADNYTTFASIAVDDLLGLMA